MTLTPEESKKYIVLDLDREEYDIFSLTDEIVLSSYTDPSGPAGKLMIHHIVALRIKAKVNKIKKKRKYIKYWESCDSIIEKIDTAFKEFDHLPEECTLECNNGCEIQKDSLFTRLAMFFMT